MKSNAQGRYAAIGAIVGALVVAGAAKTQAGTATVTIGVNFTDPKPQKQQ